MKISGYFRCRACGEYYPTTWRHDKLCKGCWMFGREKVEQGPTPTKIKIAKPAKPKPSPKPKPKPKKHPKPKELPYRVIEL